MAQLVKVNPASPNERLALDDLIDSLPRSWIVTTNIDERNFVALGLKQRPEIDCVLITPIGAYVLDFKNHKGTITPSQNGVWKRNGVPLDEPNPFDQGREHAFALRDLLKRSLNRRSPFIEWLVVFTYDGTTLNWADSGMDRNNYLRQRAILIADVESSVVQIGSGRKLSIKDARGIVRALQPAECPQGLFDSWDDQDSQSQDSDRDVPIGDDGGIPADGTQIAQEPMTCDDLGSSDGERGTAFVESLPDENCQKLVRAEAVPDGYIRAQFMYGKSFLVKLERVRRRLSRERIPKVKLRQTATAEPSDEFDRRNPNSSMRPRPKPIPASNPTKRKRTKRQPTPREESPSRALTTESSTRFAYYVGPAVIISLILLMLYFS